jgi:hypothetical protein
MERPHPYQPDIAGVKKPDPQQAPQEGGNGTRGIPPTIHEQSKPPPKSAINKSPHTPEQIEKIEERRDITAIGAEFMGARYVKYGKDVVLYFTEEQKRVARDEMEREFKFREIHEKNLERQRQSKRRYRQKLKEKRIFLKALGGDNSSTEPRHDL